MAKNKINMSKLSLGSAMPVVKQAQEAKQPEAALEEAVREIHAQEKAVVASVPIAKKEKLPKVSEPIIEEPKRMGRPPTRDRANSVRLSIDVPKPLVKRAKRKLIDLEITMIEYVTRLIEKDLEE